MKVWKTACPARCTRGWFVAVLAVAMSSVALTDTRGIGKAF